MKPSEHQVNTWRSLLLLLCGSATSKLFATCSGEEIRVWMVGKPKDQLRITVPNVTCNAIDFMHDDCSIISGEIQSLSNVLILQDAFYILSHYNYKLQHILLGSYVFDQHKV